MCPQPFLLSWGRQQKPQHTLSLHTPTAQIPPPEHWEQRSWQRLCSTPSTHPSASLPAANVPV